MTLSNNSTPSQAVEIVDPEGSCKKDNSKPVHRFKCKIENCNLQDCCEHKCTQYFRLPCKTCFPEEEE